MEPATAGRLSARKRRAVGLIVISILALAAAGLTWIVPALHPGGDASSTNVFDARHAWAQLSSFVPTNAAGFQTSAVVVTNDGGLSWTRVSPPTL